MRHVLGRRQQSDKLASIETDPNGAPNLPCGHRLFRAWIPPAFWTALIIVAIRRRCATCRCSPAFLYSLNSARTWQSSQPIRCRSDGIVRTPQEATCAICASASSFAFIGSTIRGSSARRKDTVDSAFGNLHNKQHRSERPTMQGRTIKCAVLTSAWQSSRRRGHFRLPHCRQAGTQSA